MRIGLVRRGFSATGGAEAYLLRLAGGLHAAGHEPVLVTSGDWPQEAWRFGSMVRINGSSPTAFATDFRGVRSQFDVTLSLDRTPGCDVFRAGDGVHAAWLKRRAAFEPRWRSFLRRWNPKHGALVLLEREVFREARFVIANSHMVAREIELYHAFPNDRLRVIPNGLTSALPRIPRENARRQLGLSDSTFVVLFVGTGWERKGLSTAMAAMPLLEDDSLLLVAGRGKPVQAPRVRFLGPMTDDLPAVFSAADVFTLPTIYDPFSNACLEALAAGLPVVTTDANGFSEILEPGRHGDIVPPGDAHALAAALARWRNHTSPSPECQQRAAQFSIERNVCATLDVLEEAVGESSA